MKRIDRYVLHGYVVRLVVAHLVVFGLFMSFDALQRLDQMQKGGLGETVPLVLAYYAYQFPSRVLDTVPPLLLLSAGLLVVQMSSSGELLTLKAGGVSVRRVMTPVVLFTLPLVVLLFWTRERVVPWAFRQQALLDRELEQKVAGPFLLQDDREGFRLFVDSYDFGRQSMSRVTVMTFRPNGVVMTLMQAESGVWIPEEQQQGPSAAGDKLDIVLESTVFQQFDEGGNVVGDPRVYTTRELETSLTPYEFVRARQDVMSGGLPTLSLGGLRRQIRRNPENPQFRVMYHSRLAEPLVPFVLLLIGIPLLVGLEQSLQSRALGAIISITVAAGYHVLGFVFASMGIAGYIPPVAAAWTVPVLGCGVGLWMFRRMRT